MIHQRSLVSSTHFPNVQKMHQAQYKHTFVLKKNQPTTITFKKIFNHHDNVLVQVWDCRFSCQSYKNLFLNLFQFPQEFRKSWEFNIWAFHTANGPMEFSCHLENRNWLIWWCLISLSTSCGLHRIILQQMKIHVPVCATHTCIFILLHCRFQNFELLLNNNILQ